MKPVTPRGLERTVQGETYVREKVGHVEIVGLSSVASSSLCGAVKVRGQSEVWTQRGQLCCPNSGCSWSDGNESPLQDSNPERSGVHTARDLFNTSRVHNRLP